MTSGRSKPTLFVHIGRPKTGTSAFQYLMRENTQPGWLYPETGQWPDGAHHKLLMAFNGTERRGNIQIEPFAEQFAALQTEIEESGGSNVIISSEGLFGKGGLDFVQELRCTIGAQFESIQIIAVYRSHLEIASSLYNQQIKDPVSAETRDPDRYLEETCKSLRYRPTLERWRDAGLPARLLSYHPRATYLDRFVAALGLQPFEGDIPRPNASLLPLTTLAILAANRYTENKEDLARLSVRIRQNRALKTIATSGRFLFSTEAADRFEDSLQEDRAFVQDHLESGDAQLPSRAPHLRISEAAVRQFFDCLSEFGIPSHACDEFRHTIAPYISHNPDTASE